MFTWYYNSICYPVIVLFPITSVCNWKTILKDIQMVQLKALNIMLHV
jgi:hypothetical protein